MFDMYSDFDPTAPSSGKLRAEIVIDPAAVSQVIANEGRDHWREPNGVRAPAKRIDGALRPLRNACGAIWNG